MGILFNIYFKNYWSSKDKYPLASVSQSLPKSNTSSSAVTIPAWDLHKSNSSSMVSLNTKLVSFWNCLSWCSFWSCSNTSLQQLKLFLHLLHFMVDVAWFIKDFSIIIYHSIGLICHKPIFDLYFNVGTPIGVVLTNICPPGGGRGSGNEPAYNTTVRVWGKNLVYSIHS